ncbi:MAG TPA: trehalase family glycosidase [Chthoniobacteraceae bacterium]|nr:trehalase family glycosidase [Chthoniobacteraceae bacterium]
MRIACVACACLALAGTLRSQVPVQVGNFLRGAPCGIAWIIDDSAAFVMDTGGPYMAGTAAPDDRYHACRFRHGGAVVEFDWGRVGDDAVGVISTDKAVSLNLSLSSGWPGWVSRFAPAPGGVDGIADAASGKINWSLRLSPAPVAVSGSGVTVAVQPGSPVRFVAGLKALPGFGVIDGILNSAKQSYEASRPVAAGDWGDFLGAIEDNMNNSRLYASDNHRLAHSVSRRWAHSPNGSPYFCWDSFFTADLAALNDLAGARDTFRAILSCQSPDGLVPNFGHWNDHAPANSVDRSQPPVASLCAWKIHQRFPDDRAFLAEIYPALVRWHDWWPKSRNGKGDGLLEWGSATGNFQAAQYETGWDDNLHFAGAAMHGDTMNAYAVDLCSLWSMDAQYLALIADFLGHPQDAARFRADHETMNREINDRLWNSALGIYCSRFWSDAGPDASRGEFLTRLTPMNFYPLLAGAADSERGNEAMRLLTDPKKFWGPYLLPTLAYDDPDYHQQEYWRGDVWGPVNYLVWQGIKRYGTAAQMAEFADRSVRLFMTNWEEKGVCGENYLSTTGAQARDPHYTWGALLDLIGLESIVDVDDSGQVVLNGAHTRNVTLTRVPILGKIYDVKVSPGRTELIRNGATILVAKGDIVRARLP